MSLFNFPLCQLVMLLSWLSVMFSTVGWLVFTGEQNILNGTSLWGKLTSWWSLTRQVRSAGQFAWHMTLNETPGWKLVGLLFDRSISTSICVGGEERNDKMSYPPFPCKQSVCLHNKKKIIQWLAGINSISWLICQKLFYQPFPLSGLSFIAYCNMRLKALMKKMMTMFTNNG